MHWLAKMPLYSLHLVKDGKQKRVSFSPVKRHEDVVQTRRAWGSWGRALPGELLFKCPNSSCPFLVKSSHGMGPLKVWSLRDEKGWREKFSIVTAYTSPAMCGVEARMLITEYNV